MNKPRLIYFDAAVSRGEECRLALCLAGVEFEDVRVVQAERSRSSIASTRQSATTNA